MAIGLPSILPGMRAGGQCMQLHGPCAHRILILSPFFKCCQFPSAILALIHLVVLCTENGIESLEQTSVGQLEAAGLAIGVVGIASLFTSCIEAFDIVVRAREFGRDFDLLCTQLSLQRVRLLLWGETIGLASELPPTKSPYYRRLERDDRIAPAIESTLHHLRYLLQTADLITDRYTTQPGSTTEHVQVEPSKGLTIFRDTFDSFKSRIRRDHDAKSTWTVTRWAIHDLGKFRELITNIKDLIDGLEGITSAVGLLLERQHALLTKEVEAICDTESLHLLQSVVAETAEKDERSPSLKFLSDAAKHRLSVISDSRLTGLLYSNLSSRASSIRSYRTALSYRVDAASIPSLVEELDEDELSILARVPSLSEGVEEEEEEGPGRASGSEATTQAVESRIRQQEVRPTITNDTKPHKRAPTSSPAPETVPQNQRLIADLIRKSQIQPCPPTTLRSQPDFPFSPSKYGNILAPHKEKDTNLWSSQSTNFLIHADKGNLSARRIFLELRSIQSAGIPFISAAPLNDGCLDKLIARIEGPPGTPYEGGIFWILVSFSPSSSSPDDPSLGPPSLKFLTRIYHPNIDCQGNICGGGNYSEWWNDLEQIGTKSTSSSRQPTGPWFSSKKSNWFSLGALLTALCGLLATPNVEDPLVVEIAETYLRDYEAYCAAARFYTERYAGRDVKPPGLMSLAEVGKTGGSGMA
ncbi:Prion-inhibition and propagation domain containing protein [Naviculisporaceae sp. PSN 640]